MLDLITSHHSQSTPVKSSTFRRLPLRKVHGPSRTLGDQAPMHSRSTSVSSLHPRSDTEADLTPAVLPGPSPSVYPISPPSARMDITANNYILRDPVIPPPVSRSSSVNSASNWDVPVSNKLFLPSLPASRKLAPYPIGFQPKGAFRVLTDDFLSARRMKREGEGGGMKRVERTKLERRLEKLVNLHFPPPGARDVPLDEKTRPGISGHENHRTSSIFDFQTLKNVNFSNASDLWKGVVSSGLRDTIKMEIRG